MKLNTIIFIVGILIVLSGCATTGPRDAGVARLESKMTRLERRVASLEHEQKSVQNALNSQQDLNRAMQNFMDIYEAKKQGISLNNVTTKMIQTALKNVGLYKGSIDGKVETGRRSRIHRRRKSVCFQAARELSARFDRK